MTSDIRGTVVELVGHYVALANSLTPGSTARGGGHSSGKPGSRPPISLEVSQELADIAHLADDLAQRLRDALRFEHRQTQAIPQLRAIPALVEALPDSDPVALVVRDALDDARRHARVVLALDPRPMLLAATCPECQLRDEKGRGTLLADAERGEVWCRNRDCGYECGRTGCLCADPENPRLHRYKWGRDDLLRLGDMLDEVAS